MCPPAHWPSECRPGWYATSRYETRPRRSGGWADPDPGLRRPALGSAGGPDEQSRSDAAVDGGAWSAGGVTGPPVGVRGDEPADLVWRGPVSGPPFGGGVGPGRVGAVDRRLRFAARRAGERFGERG